jgi:ABC-type branched-subunit amino acid transport system ATPase component
MTSVTVVPETRAIDDDVPALEIVHLSKSFGKLQVLSGIDIVIRRGEFVAVVGPNGAGKTTWCNIVTGFEPASSGSVVLNGSPIDHLKPYQRYHAGITRTFQTPRLLEALTLEENVAVAIRAPRGKALERARTFLSDLGVDRMDSFGGEASLYERRVVEIGRAVANAPSVMILDEPLAGLAQADHDAILGLASRVASEGVAVVVIEHLIPTIAPVVDRMVVLAGNKVLADGLPGEVLTHQSVVDAYLGQPLTDIESR